MQYSVKGITFTEEELSTVKLEQLSADSISGHHLFTFLNKRPFLLLRAGDYLDAEFLQKYRSRGVETFRCLEVAPRDEILIWRRHFQSFRAARKETEKLVARDELLRVFGDHYWRQSEKSFLSFAIACFEEFHRLPIELMQNLQDASLSLYSRALAAGSYAVLASVLETLLDYDFFQDIFNCALLLDYGFVGGGEFDFLLARACELERKRPGDGLLYLESNAKAQTERSLFYEHPHLSAEIAFKHSACFHYPELIEHIRYHHENADGSGFPAGHGRSSLAQSETILAFADRMAPFEEHIFKRGDGSYLVKDAFANLQVLGKDQLFPARSILVAWEKAFEWVASEVISEDKDHRVEKKESA